MKRLVLAVALSVGADPPRSQPIFHRQWRRPRGLLRPTFRLRFLITIGPASISAAIVGYGFTSSSTLSDSQRSTFTNTSSGAFLGGGQVGVNWEFGPGVVIGAEADFEWLPNTKNTVTAHWYWRQFSVYGYGEHQQSLADAGRRQARLCLGPSAGLRQGRRRVCRRKQFNTERQFGDHVFASFRPGQQYGLEFRRRG